MILRAFIFTGHVVFAVCQGVLLVLSGSSPAEILGAIIQAVGIEMPSFQARWPEAMKSKRDQLMNRPCPAAVIAREVYFQVTMPIKAELLEAAPGTLSPVAPDPTVGRSLIQAFITRDRQPSFSRLGHRWTSMSGLLVPVVFPHCRDRSSVSYQGA
jgi:hypothetical protein